MLDLHVHLKGGLTLEQALERSRLDGIQFGIAVNCGKGFPVQNDAAAIEFCRSLRGQPVYIGMQAEGREWTNMFSQAAAAEFDYIFTDAMTWTDDHGRRMRLWIAEEVGTIEDPEGFMDTLVACTVEILEHEPIDIFVNPTFLPASLANDYDRLWTNDRMTRVIEAAVRNGVAIELNDLYHLPGKKFVLMAKAAGCKFTLGTNNTGPHDLGRSEYGLRTAAECGLTGDDFFVPGKAEPRAAVRKAAAFHS
jgi:histidinol phosphatase-like PHP family hydrolase